jgi:hypothetical protein
MFQLRDSIAIETRKDGVAGNSRLTAALGAVLLVLLAAEGATIPFIGQLRVEHILIGVLLLGPIAAKLASTGYRFARYYLGSDTYQRKGPPPPILRLLAPGVVFTTVALFGTGVALLLAGKPNDQLVFLHKASFIAWVALMTVHVLGHVIELPALALADWRRGEPREVRLAGAAPRLAAVVGAIALGTALALLSLSAAGSWG